MKNFIQPGNSIDVILGADHTSGAPLKVGSIVGVASTDGLNTETIALCLTGIYELDKTTGQAWTAGAKLYWEDTTKKATTTVGSNTFFGYATQIQASGDTVGNVLLARAGV